MAEKNRSRTKSNGSTSKRGYNSSGTARSGNVRTSSKRSKEQSSGTNIAGTLSVIIVVIMVLGGIAAVLLWNDVKYLFDENTIIPGVEVEGVNIGGMTEQEAYNALNQKLIEKINNFSITLKSGDEYWTYDASSLNASGDISGIINEAMQYGHRSEMTILQRMDEARYVLNNPETFKISFGYDQESIKQIVETLKTDLDVPAIEPSLEFDKDAGKLTSIDDAVALLYNPLKYDSQINVNGAPAEIYIDANGNPAILADIFTITPGSSGVVVDVEATVSAIIADLSDDSVANVEIVTTVVNPNFTEGDLSDCTSLVYHSKSGIASTSSLNRDTNVALALEAFDGMVINPGDVVSFNETTGERSQENGYLKAPIINKDKSLGEDWGGGVCQAATIIFNAAIMSGCKIIDKESHSWPMYTDADDYGSDARDAMVSWGSSDLIFENVTEYPIYFDTYCHWSSPDNATHGYCNVYTKLLPEGQSIKYEPRLVQFEEAPEAEYIPLDNLADYVDKIWKWNSELELLTYQYRPSKPKKYYDVYKLTLDANDNVIAEESWYRSHYNIITGLYYTKPDPDRETDTDGAVG